MRSLRHGRVLARVAVGALGVLVLAGLSGCVVHGHGCAPYAVEFGYVHHHGHHGHGCR